MASKLKNLSDYDLSTVPSAEDMSFGIVVTDYHTDITFTLLQACYDTLLQHGAKEKNIYISHVPGAFELPLGAKMLFQKNKIDAVISLGCVITGETTHDQFINNAVSQGLMHLSLAFGAPFIFGVLTPQSKQQALDRAGGKHGNKGTEAAVTAIKMVALAQQKPIGQKSVGF